MSEWKDTSSKAPTWNPTKDENDEPRFHADDNDFIQGIYKDKKEGVGQNNATVYIIETKDGDFSVWGTTMLNDNMSQVRVGEEVMIKWEGKKLTKQGAEKFKSVEKCTNSTMAYHSYSVKHREVPGGSAAPAQPNKPAAQALAPKSQPKAPVAQDDDMDGSPF